MLVMIMCAVTLVIMAAVMSRTSTVAKLNDRNNKYTLCNTAAAAATEKVFSRLAYDFQSYGLGQATNNLGIYRTNVPTSDENSYWGNFVFSDAQGNANRVFVNYLTNYSGALPSQYTNLFTTTAPIYRIICNASLAGYPDIIGSAQEDVLLSMVPITTYAIFYNGVLEFTATATMTVRGRTHANDMIVVGTDNTLTFMGMVSSTKTVNGQTRDAYTPSPWNKGTSFTASPSPGYATNQASITVAMTMTNSHAIIDLPANGELVGSPVGQQREYNKAFVLILVTNLPPSASTNLPTPQVTLILQTSISGLLPGADTSPRKWTYIYTNISSVPTNPALAVYVFTNYTTATYLSGPTNSQIASFLSLTNKFTDKREYQTNFFVTQIDINNLRSWLTTDPYVTAKFSGGIYPTILYVADQRNVGTNKLSAVRLVNGARLPYNNKIGFSVATPNPLYVKGPYNVTADGVNYAYTPDSTTNTGTTVPAALLCDAITILSSSFNDSTSAGAAGNACTTGTVGSNTVNAAVVTGNVPSTGTTETTFSGGVHNLMRMLEDWNGDKLILNTSIVVLWASQMATNQFRNPISWPNTPPVNPYYNPPTRQWGFDPNFYNPSLQPPGVPSALVPVRFNWTVPPPNTTNSYIGNY